MNQKSLAIAVALAAAALVATIATTPLSYAEEKEYDEHGVDGQESETETNLKGKCKNNQSGQGNLQACIPINLFIPADLIA